MAHGLCPTAANAGMPDDLGLGKRKLTLVLHFEAVGLTSMREQTSATSFASAPMG